MNGVRLDKVEGNEWGRDWMRWKAMNGVRLDKVEGNEWGRDWMR